MRIFPVKDISRYKRDDNIPKDETLNWDSKIEYSVYDRVRYGKRIYRSLADGNVSLPTSPLKWEEVGVANECAYLNGVVSDKSCSGEDIHIEFDVPDDADIIAIGGLEGSELTVRLEDSGGGLVFEDTQTLDTYRPSKMCWYDWTYPTASDVVFQNSYVRKITPQAGQKLTIDIKRGFCGACIGLLAMGATVYIGCTLQSTKREIRGSLSVSILSSNRRKLKERKGYIKMSAIVKMVEEGNIYNQGMYAIDQIQATLEKYLNIPIGVFGDDDGESYSMRIYGMYDRIQSTITPIGQYEIVVDSLDDIF
jgi:hypothetical protein